MFDIDPNMLFNDSKESKNYWNRIGHTIQSTLDLSEEFLHDKWGRQLYESARITLGEVSHRLDQMSKVFDIKINLIDTDEETRNNNVLFIRLSIQEILEFCEKNKIQIL